MRISHVIVFVALLLAGCRAQEEMRLLPVEKGTVELPLDSKALAGSYYRGDGTGYNIYLTLQPDGTYTSEWHGCVGVYGLAAGRWNIVCNQIVFAPSSETDMMKGHIRRLEVLKFKGDWIFVPVDPEDREFYNKRGVNRYSCYQKKDKVK